MARTAETFGSLRKLPSKRWQARYWGPDGKRYSAPQTFDAKPDAVAWLADERRKIQRETWEPPHAVYEAEVEKVSLTFGEYAEEVILRRLANDKIRETTAALYRKMIRLHLGKFAGLPLAQITPRQVSNWYAAMGTTPSSRKNAYGVLSTVMLEAVRDELIDKTPCRERVTKPKGRTVTDEDEVLSPQEFAKYVAEVPEAHGYRMATKLAYWGGLRSGEVRGLRRCDVDLKAGTLRVAQQVIKLDGKNIISSDLKTEAGGRVVHLPKTLVKELKKWLEDQPVRGRDSLIFPNALGQPMSGESLRYAAKKGANAIGRPNLRVHSLRHSNATLVAQGGATTAEMMGRFGWSSPAMVTKYSHAMKERDKEAANKLDALM